MKLIIQIPCYNEAETLEIALNDLPKHIDGIDEIEYLIINDGSKDNTVEVAQKWGVNYIVNFRRNKGLAYGFMAGIDACLRNGADIIVNHHQHCCKARHWYKPYKAAHKEQNQHKHHRDHPGSFPGRRRGMEGRKILLILLFHLLPPRAALPPAFLWYSFYLRA